MRLSQMTCEEVRTYFQESDMALLTVGCLENHGSHNVLGVDTQLRRGSLTACATI